ncbi:transcription factor domain-containing protein [Aspergillus stella-maris]|uniref:transcription factor domain-containing protein n=1 Tax=Aspergillus stella-maris TaxID=1810926 RepID=UPI003CCD5144
MPPKSSTDRPVRQQPGLACEECRKRKARCDRAKPQCGSCLMTGRVCIVNYDRPRRGPKKGQIESLYSRLEVLEEQLVEEVDDIAASEVEVQTHVQSSHGFQHDFGQSSHDNQREAYELPLLSPVITMTENRQEESPAFVPSLAHVALHGLSSSYINQLNTNLDLVYADLDQLYFDRVHPVAPFLHQQRYFSRVKTEPPSLARACLRSTMRTVAAALSAQFRRLADSLYVEASRLLRELDATEGVPPLAQIQALLLLAHYELLQMEESRAMVTAGRCFRLVQLSRLHDIDGYTTGLTESSLLDFASAEERRRTFWVAFCFDRFLSFRHHWPLTLQEEAIWTRLPAPESSFQSGQAPELPMDFLHEAITTSGQRLLPPFAECVILATLYGRAMNLRRMAAVRNTPEDLQAFWSRHQLLVGILEKRNQLWSWSSASLAGFTDPIIAFIPLLGKAALLYALKISAIADPYTPVIRYGLGPTMRTELLAEGNAAFTANWTSERAMSAANELMVIARSMCPINCFRAHPFLPNALSCAAVYLSTDDDVAGGRFLPRAAEVEELCQMLQDLQVVNNLAKEVLKEIDKSDMGGLD